MLAAAAAGGKEFLEWQPDFVLPEGK